MSKPYLVWLKVQLTDEQLTELWNEYRRTTHRDPPPTRSTDEYRKTLDTVLRRYLSTHFSTKGHFE